MAVVKENEITQYKRKGNLTGKKLMEYIPPLIITQLSSLLLNSVDSIVAGNFVGADALSSINLFYPVTLFTGAISVLASSGISTSLSTAMGRNDPAATDRIKGVSLRLMILMAVCMSIVQIPIVWLIIKSYGLSGDMYTMIWQYAIGIMIGAPLSLVSNVGSYELQVLGKMKPVMYISLSEGIANIAFDLLFAGVLDMGVAGIGYGTACANLIRCAVTIIYIRRCTDIYKSKIKTVKLSDMTEVLSYGVSDASNNLVNAVQTYLMMQIIIAIFGAAGGIVKGVCTLTYNTANVFMSSISGGSRPLMGLLAGADDKKGLNILLRQGTLLNAVLTGLTTIVILMTPGLFYRIYGVTDIPDGGILAVRLYSLCLVLKGISFLYKMYFNNNGDAKFCTILSVLGHSSLVLFAFVLYKLLASPVLFAAYPLSEVFLFILERIRYRRLLNKTYDEGRDKGMELVLNMTVKSDEASDASSELRSYAEENGIDGELSERVAACMEKMIEYATSSTAAERITKYTESNGIGKRLVELLVSSDKAEWLQKILKDVSTNLRVAVMVKFIPEGDTLLVTLDDGECISLNANEEVQELIEEHGKEMKELADNVEYEYILNMNYSRVTFS